MAAVDFVALQNLLKSLGFYDFVLPWLLAFAIVFGILDKSGIFGAEKKPANKGVEALIALAFAFYVTLFTPYPGFLSSFFSNLFGGSIMVLSGVLVLLLFIGLVGLTPDVLTQGWGKWAFVGLGVVIALGLFLNAGGSLFGFGGVNLGGSTEWLTLVIFFGIIALVIYAVVHEKKEEGEQPAAAPAPRR